MIAPADAAVFTFDGGGAPSCATHAIGAGWSVHDCQLGFPVVRGPTEEPEQGAHPARRRPRGPREPTGLRARLRLSSFTSYAFVPGFTGAR